MFYTIGEMAKKMGVAPSTLRYYDKEGLLPFVERSGSGIRMFKDEDIEWLSIIECLKKTGMPIKEIKKFIDWCIEGDSTIDKRLELIDRRRERVHEQMAQLKKRSTRSIISTGTTRPRRRRAPAKCMSRWQKKIFHRECAR